MRTLLVMTALLTSSASFGKASRAAALAQEADQHYRDGQFRQAALKLNGAWEIDPTPLYLYNIARAWEQSAEFKLAVDSYRRYLAEPPAKTQEDLRQKAELAIDRLQKRMNRSNGQSIFAGPLGTGVVIAGGVTIATVGTSIGMAVAASGARSAFTRAETLSDKQRLERDTKTFAAVADVTLGLAVAAAVTTGILFYVASTSPVSDDRISIGVTVAPGSFGASIGGKL
jgi:hypothetical protein